MRVPVYNKRSSPSPYVEQTGHASSHESFASSVVVRLLLNWTPPNNNDQFPFMPFLFNFRPNKMILQFSLMSLTFISFVFFSLSLIWSNLCFFLNQQEPFYRRKSYGYFIRSLPHTRIIQEYIDVSLLTLSTTALAYLFATLENRRINFLSLCVQLILQCIYLFDTVGKAVFLRKIEKSEPNHDAVG